MKKALSILIVASSTLVICAGLVTTLHGGFKLSKATDGIEENTITFTSANVISTKEEYGCRYFELKATQATVSKFDYSATEDCNYCYGNVSISAGQDGHIFVADGGAYSYADVYFGLSLPCGYMDEVTRVTLNGSFYYNSYKTNPTTSIEYTEADLTGSDLIIYEADLYKAVLDSIVIEYSCLIY